MMRYRLRTLLIVFALGPMVMAGGYWAWDAMRPKPSPWYISDQDSNYDLPQNTPGYRWKLTREEGFIEVPIDPPELVD